MSIAASKKKKENEEETRKPSQSAYVASSQDKTANQEIDRVENIAKNL